MISWDTAMKANELADYSVGTVWRVKDRGQKILLVDLVRGRFEYPELVAAASALYRKWKVDWATTNLVIEDKGSGSSLIQSLKSERIWAHQHHAKLEGDKVMRLSAQAAHFHAGSVHFPQNAAWLGELMLELLGFPGVRHDDQVELGFAGACFYRLARIASKFLHALVHVTTIGTCWTTATCSPAKSAARGAPAHQCPLSGAKRTCLFAPHMSAFDPKRTFGARLQSKSTGACVPLEDRIVVGRRLKREDGFLN